MTICFETCINGYGVDVMVEIRGENMIIVRVPNPLSADSGGELDPRHLGFDFWRDFTREFQNEIRSNSSVEL